MAKEFKVGLIALISGAFLYYGFNYLKGIDFFSPTHKYFAVYENVDGLSKSNPVIVNGLQVGRVSRIRLIQNTENLILVELDIDKTVKLGDSTVASLTNTDILGSKGVVLTIGHKRTILEPGDTLISNVDRGLNEILESATPVANNLNTTITRVNEILIGLKGSGEKINRTLGELETMTRTVNQIINDNQRQIALITSKTVVLIEKLNQKMDKIDPMLAKANGVLDSLNNLEINETLLSVRSALGAVEGTLEALQDERGTLGRLMKDDSLYNTLNQTLIDLDRLLIHINEYPKDFFSPLGRKHKKVMQNIKKDD